MPRQTLTAPPPSLFPGLIFSGRVLKEDKTLADYNIEDGGAHAQRQGRRSVGEGRKSCDVARLLLFPSPSAASLPTVASLCPRRGSLLSSLSVHWRLAVAFFDLPRWARAAREARGLCKRSAVRQAAQPAATSPCKPGVSPLPPHEAVARATSHSRRTLCLLLTRTHRAHPRPHPPPPSPSPSAAVHMVVSRPTAAPAPASAPSGGASGAAASSSPLGGAVPQLPPGVDRQALLRMVSSPQGQMMVGAVCCHRAPGSILEANPTHSEPAAPGVTMLGLASTRKCPVPPSPPLSFPTQIRAALSSPQLMEQIMQSNPALANNPEAAGTEEGKGDGVLCYFAVSPGRVFRSLSAAASLSSSTPPPPSHAPRPRVSPRPVRPAAYRTVRSGELHRPIVGGRRALRAASLIASVLLLPRPTHVSTI